MSDSRPPSSQAVLRWGLRCLAGMVALGLLAAGGTAPLDAWVYSWRLDPDSAIGQVSVMLSRLGVLASLLLFLAVAVRACWRRPGWVGVLLRAVVMLATFVAVIPLQNLFQGAAPPVVDDPWSYPSGHATVVTTLAVTSVVLCNARVRSWRTPVLVLQAVAVFTTMLSRVLLGQHYVADVLGAVLGFTGIGLLTALLLGLLPVRRGLPA